MAKTESTVVNALVGGRPRHSEPAVDLFAGLPSLAQSRAVKPAQRAEIPALPRARSAQGTTPQPIAPPKAKIAMAPQPTLPPPQAAPAAPQKVAEIYNATTRVALAGRGPHWLWFAVPAVLIGSVGASLVMRMREPAAAHAPSAPVALSVTAPATAPATATATATAAAAAAATAPASASASATATAPATAPATAVVVAPIVTVTTPPVIDVRFDSEPAGATVTLIDHGRPRFLGVTPVIVGVDSASEAEVVFTGEGRQTQLAHFDPRTTQHVATVLPAEPVVAPVPPHGRVARVARRHR